MIGKRIWVSDTPAIYLETDTKITTTYMEGKWMRVNDTPAIYLDTDTKITTRYMESKWISSSIDYVHIDVV